MHPTISNRRQQALLVSLTLASILGTALPASADEGGVSFWLPGQFASFAAIAPAPGFSMPIQNYYYSGSAEKDKTLNRGGELSLGLDTSFAGAFITPTWTPDTKIFGAQPSFSLTIFPGWNEVSVDADAFGRSAHRSDSVSGFGDIYPTAQLFWNSGVHNWMTYVTGDIPVGVYDPDALANLGLGHAAIDVGGAYTYLNPTTGWEFSATAGLTWNFENDDTDYTSGVDSHLDVGMSRSLANGFFYGLVGYAYLQLTPDDGQPAILGDFESQTFAVGPQVGYTFNVGDRSIYTNLRGYAEFGSKRRTEGGGVYLTVSIPIGKTGS